MSSSHPHSRNSGVPVDAAETSIDQSVAGSLGNLSDAEIELALSSEKIPPLFQLAKPKQGKTWIWIAVLASVGLHLGLMLIPTGTEARTAQEAGKASPHHSASDFDKNACHQDTSEAIALKTSTC